VPHTAPWGEEFEIVGKMYDVAAIWKDIAPNHATSIPGCGHLPDEECPEVVNELLMKFLGGWAV
jgi:haloacetate dehalogenase